MLFYILFSAYIIYVVWGHDIRMYFWNKKSPEVKYAEYRKFINDWNGTDYD